LTAFAFEGNDIDQKLGFNQLHNLKTLTEGPSKFDLVIVPIRNPIDSIKSTIKMFEYDPNDFDSIFKLVSENLVWLQTVRENKDNLLIIDFNTLTQDPEIVINKISEHINVIPKIFDPQDVVDRINSDNLNIHLPNNVTSSASIEITDEEILAVLEQSTDIYNEIIG
jgi:hypothetical protein